MFMERVVEDRLDNVHQCRLDDAVAHGWDGRRELHTAANRNWDRLPSRIPIILCEDRHFQYSRRVASAESIP
jgi:hypothetical protein